MTAIPRDVRCSNWPASKTVMAEAKHSSITSWGTGFKTSFWLFYRFNKLRLKLNEGNLTLTIRKNLKTLSGNKKMLNEINLKMFTVNIFSWIKTKWEFHNFSFVYFQCLCRFTKYSSKDFSAHCLFWENFQTRGKLLPTHCSSAFKTS